ncbi:hypothetical protein HS088_TW13G00938 [Tripterygium wilfordii]|uniref:Uncharacterized protein n=1 Tax=Tripterygium wilfordii TaxID=458696 RepID=A0A7J7CVI1_TRIWF|nr:uncharacterized protein LOC120012311 [Tripterygium wilfordii]KAF5738044.1 hypothetical protein HS088_TW13G00938 [Tripterygium wilfordii]
MQDSRMPQLEYISIPRPRKRKTPTQKPAMFLVQVSDVKDVQQAPSPPLVRAEKKSSKRSMKKEPSSLFQQPERSNSDTLPDSSPLGNEYRTLRLKYLLMEEQNFALERELLELEDEVKTLEDEKLSLLDRLVVLEGLVDP